MSSDEAPSGVEVGCHFALPFSISKCGAFARLTGALGGVGMV